MSDLPPKVFMRRKIAADYVSQQHGVPCSAQSLAKLAVIGGGPQFRKNGRWPVYTREDLDAWMASRLSKPIRSTSELTSVRAAAEAA